LGGSKIFLYLSQTIPISLDDIIRDISAYTEIIPVIFYLYFEERIKDKRLRVIFFLLFLGFITDLYGLFRVWDKENNFVVYNINLLLESIFIYTFFFKILNSSLAKKLLIAAGIILVAIWINMFSQGGNQDYLNTFQTLENISIFALSIYFFYEQIFKLNTPFVSNEPRFWVVAAYLIYSAGTFFLLLYLPSLSEENRETYYVLNYIFIIVRTIILSVAIFMKTDIQSPQKFS
jgi:hypothetical protein